MSTWSAPAAQIAATYRPLAWGPGATWGYVLEQMTATALDRARLARLADDLKQRGQEEPVRVMSAGCDPDDEECTGEPDCCPARVLDGMHRMTLGLLAGTDVLVTDERQPAGGDDYRWTETVLTVAPPAGDEDWDSDLIDQLSHRSCPTQWLTVALIACQGRGEPLVELTIGWDDEAVGEMTTTHEHVRAVVVALGAVVVSLSSSTVDGEGE